MYKRQVKRMAILRAIVRHLVRGHAERDHGRIFRPALIELHEGAQNFSVIFRIVLRGHDEIPRLCIVGRRSPARRFEHAAQFFLFDGFRVERARAPAMADQIVNGHCGWSGSLVVGHESSLKWENIRPRIGCRRTGCGFSELAVRCAAIERNRRSTRLPRMPLEAGARP